MTLDELKIKHPDVYAAAVAQGEAAGASAAVSAKQARIEEGKTAGAEAERKRITGIMGASIPGHEAIVEAAIADGKSTAGDVALKIVAAEKTVRAAALDKFKKDGEEAARAAATTVTVAVDKKDSEADKSLPVAERAKATWDKDPAIRAEFGTIGAYQSYLENSEAGRIRILGKK